jgi:23S rRNA (cytidine2498-2'-O)-methyltransferase
MRMRPYNVSAAPGNTGSPASETYARVYVPTSAVRRTDLVPLAARSEDTAIVLLLASAAHGAPGSAPTVSSSKSSQNSAPAQPPAGTSDGAVLGTAEVDGALVGSPAALDAIGVVPLPAALGPALGEGGVLGDAGVDPAPLGPGGCALVPVGVADVLELAAALDVGELGVATVFWVRSPVPLLQPTNITGISARDRATEGSATEGTVVVRTAAKLSRKRWRERGRWLNMSSRRVYDEERLDHNANACATSSPRAKFERLTAAPRHPIRGRVQRLDMTGYLADAPYRAGLLAELARVESVHGDLVLAAGPPQISHWAKNVWRSVYRFEASSIRNISDQLCALQRNWWPYAYQLHRRSALVQKALPHVKARALSFPEAAPQAPLGSFTLLDERQILCSPDCSSAFPNGEANFIEYGEQEGPPSRAYLKLFEALTRLGVMPGPQQTCLELGASPGGWTWVLGKLGAKVIAIDRAPLAPLVARMPGVEMRQGNAFTATPESIGRVDWLFSDVICYPEKLFGHVKRWLESGLCERFVCTLKFQGQDYSAARLFETLPGGQVVHLSHNRHELTFLRLAPGDDAQAEAKRSPWR